MTVYVVLRDDGNSQVSEYSVDSVWSTSEQAHARGTSLITPYGYRVQVATLDPVFLLGAV
jgi:hypothetical protein